MYIKKFMVVISALIFYLIFTPSLEALAAPEPELNVKVTTGFNGKAKYGEGLPITLTVENKGDAFSGDIVLDLAESYSLGNAQSIPFEIGARETKTVQIAASGLAEDYMYSGNSVQLIHFFEGGWEKGKSIAYKGNKTVKPNFSDPATTFYLTLTESADRLKVLTQLKQPNQVNNEIIHVAQQSNFTLPDEGVAWEMADYIIIDEFVIADLTEQQQQAFIDYVSSGGIIVIGASDNVIGELGNLADYLPLNLHTTTQSITPQNLGALTGSLLTNDLKLYDATLNNGSTPLVQLDGMILAGKKQLGSGTIIQTTFSLGDAPLADDPVYNDLMSTILQSVQVKNTQSMYGHNMKDELVYNLGETNSLFSSFKVSTPLMIGIVVFYMIIIVPLLYIILKRKDKREYAWGIIPLTAIIASLAIFGYGAKDRIARPQVQQSSFLQVNEDKSLQGYYAESILSNKGGDFTFEAPNTTTMVAKRGTNSLTGQTANVHENAIMEKHATKSELIFRDVGYWSVSSLFGETQLQDVGNFNVDLTVDSSKIHGTVQSNFPFGLKDVSIWSGSKLYKLGDMAAGDKIEINKDLGTVMLMPISNPYASASYGTYNANQMDLITQRKQALYSSSLMLNNSNSTPAITGFAEDNILPVELKDKKVELSALHLVIQPFTATTIFSGEFTLPANTFSVVVNTEQFGKYMEPVQGNNFEWYLDDGEYNVHWKVPDTLPLDKVNWTQLQIANTDRNSHTIEIWNLETKSFEEITESRFTLTENINTYIDQSGVIQYKLIKKSVQGDPYTRLPEVRMKGEVKQ